MSVRRLPIEQTSHLLDVLDPWREPLRDLLNDLLNEGLVLHRLTRLHNTVVCVAINDLPL